SSRTRERVTKSDLRDTKFIFALGDSKIQCRPYPGRNRPLVMKYVLRKISQSSLVRFNFATRRYWLWIVKSPGCHVVRHFAVVRQPKHSEDPVFIQPTFEEPKSYGLLVQNASDRSHC